MMSEGAAESAVPPQPSVWAAVVQTRKDIEAQQQRLVASQETFEALTLAIERRAISPWSEAEMIALHGLHVAVCTALGREPAESQLRAIRDERDRLKREVGYKDEVLRQKNLALDALHYVWCDGGCQGGVHRHDPNEMTEEVVQAAERNTQRLRHWLENRRARQLRGD